MSRLDVYRSPGKSGRFYVLDIQADLLAELTTRVVVPLIPVGAVRKIAADLNPVFEVEGQRHVMLTQAVATVPKRESCVRLSCRCTNTTIWCCARSTFC
jgi:toxin CcdB